MQRSIFLLVAALFIASLAHAGDAGRLQRHEKGIWSIAGTASANRWIVVHNLREAAETGMYHIEVLGRGKGDPQWKVERIRPHLAITPQALDRSVLDALSSGAVYPEGFDDAFRRWQEERSRGGAFVCTTSVLQCLESN